MKGKTDMKKVISVFLAVVMVFSVFAVTAAAVTSEKAKYPIIFIAGNSIVISDAEGNPLSTGFEVLTDDDEGDMDTQKIIQAAMNIIIPFVTEGLPFDKWDNYGKALYEELAPIWDESQIDGDGNPKYGTGISEADINSINKNALKDYGADGIFNYADYKFLYDWRLSPYEHVDRLHEFIKTVLDTTKCEKVCLIGRCIGGNVINAYLDTYGSEGLVAKVMFDEVMSNGSATVNDCYSGKIKFSDKHLQAFLLESEYFGKENRAEFLPWPEWAKLTADEEKVSRTYRHISHCNNYSCEKARRILGYVPGYTGMEAVHEAVEAMLKNGMIRL